MITFRSERAGGQRLAALLLALPALSACSESPPRNSVEQMMIGDAGAATTRLSVYVAAHQHDAALAGTLIAAGFKQTFSDAQTGCRAYRYTKKLSMFSAREGFVRLCPQEHAAQVSYS